MKKNLVLLATLFSGLQVIQGAANTPAEIQKNEAEYQRRKKAFEDAHGEAYLLTGVIQPNEAIPAYPNTEFSEGRQTGESDFLYQILKVGATNKIKRWDTGKPQNLEIFKTDEQITYAQHVLTDIAHAFLVLFDRELRKEYWEKAREEEKKAKNTGQTPNYKIIVEDIFNKAKQSGNSFENGLYELRGLGIKLEIKAKNAAQRPAPQPLSSSSSSSITITALIPSSSSSGTTKPISQEEIQHDLSRLQGSLLKIQLAIT